jgi:drug/metabolite transporter (DMT)-like permease
LALLGEGISLRFGLASVLVLGGVMWASLPARRQNPDVGTKG